MMKRGDWVRVWDDNKDEAVVTRYLSEVGGARFPYLCVDEFSADIEAFERGDLFDITHWKHAEPIEDPRRKGIVNGTRVLVEDRRDCITTRRYATGEWTPDGCILCWDGGGDEWSSCGAKHPWRFWQLAEEPWQPKVGDRVKLVKVDPMWGGEDRSNPVWGSKYGQVGGSIIDAERDGTFIVMWDNFTRNSCYTTDHLQPL